MHALSKKITTFARFYRLNMNPDNQNPFSFIAEYDGDEKAIYDITFDELLPIMPLRDIALFPGVIIPITVGRIGSIRVCRRAYEEGSYIVCATQKSPEVDLPQSSDLYDIAVVARVIRIYELPDDTTTAIVQGFAPVALTDVYASDGTIMGKVTRLHELYEEMESETYHLLRESLHSQLREYVSLNEQFSAEATSALTNIATMLKRNS